MRFLVRVPRPWVLLLSLAAVLFGGLGVADSRGASPTLPPQVAEINSAIEQQWRDFEIKPAPEVEDDRWCRRVFLDLIGRIPSVDELNEFLADNAAQRRSNLVERLLEGERYAEEYANHWATVWCNVLIGRSGGTERDSLTSRDGMMKYLRDSFAANKPYDRMVFELVTAEGATKPGAPNFNGAANFLADKVNAEDAVLATSSTSRIFLGLQVQCTQCHNHPFNQWKQQKFWDFNAFFRQTRALRRFVPGTNDVDHSELVSEDYEGQGGDASDALIYYELRNGLIKTAYPVFVDDTEIGKSGYVSEVNRRLELGKLIVASPYLDKMMVNRFWSHFLGQGFTKPIDDIGPHNAPSHPDLLEYLSKEVRGNSHDCKQLMRWIVLSKPYQLAARHSAANEVDDPSVGEAPKFSHFYLRQMTAEQLYQSMVTSSGAKAAGSYERQEQERRRWMQQFVVAFGTDEGDEATTFNGSIPQALMLFNGELTRQAISDEDGGFLKTVISQNRNTRDRVNQLFLAGLSRRASKDELMVASKLLTAREGDEIAMLQDMWWAIINSNEFIMQH